MYSIRMADLTTGYLMWRVTTKWRVAVDRALSHLGLTHAQYTLLASLYGLSRTGAQPSQRELADFAGLEAIYVSKLARALEQAGLVSRITHPADPRAVQLALTARGTDVADQAIAAVHALQEELTAPIGGVGGERNKELARTLRALLGIDANGSDEMTTVPTLTGQDIAEAQGAVRALLERTLASSGTTGTEYVVLRVLAVRGPMDTRAALQGFLASQRQLGLDLAEAEALVAGLEARGLIAAEPVRLTDEGAALHTELAARVGPVTAELYAGFDQEELAVAHRVLTAVTARADRLGAS